MGSSRHFAPRGVSRAPRLFAALAVLSTWIACAPPEGATLDAGETRVDAGTGDAGVTGAGAGDAGLGDAGMGDAGLSDAGMGDAGLSDAGLSDAGMGDAGLMDAGVTGAPIVPAADCAGVVVTTDTVTAGSLVRFTDVPLDGAFRVRIRASHLQSAVFPRVDTRAESDGGVSLVMRAPSTPDTMDVTTRYVIETSADSGVHFCHYKSLDVLPLEDAGVETFETQVTAIQNLHTALLANHGLSPADLVNPAPADMERLAPFVISRAMIDHVDNPLSLRSILNGTAPGLVLSTQDRVYLDRLVATARMHHMPVVPQPSLSACAVALDQIQTAEQLSCWMTVGRDVNAVLGSPGAVAVRATIGAAIGAAGALTSVPSAGTSLAVAALANAALNASIDAASNLTPHTFTHLWTNNTGTHVCENELLQIISADVRAKSKGWQITYVQALDWALSIVGVFKAAHAAATAAEAAKVAQAADVATDIVKTKLEQAVPHINNILINYFGVAFPAAPNALVLYDIPPQTWGPITLPLQYLVLSTNSPNVTLSGAAYSATAGRGYVEVAVEPMLFGGAEVRESVLVIGHDQALELDPIHAQPGEDLLATATAHCISGASLTWTMGGYAVSNGGSTIDHQIGTFTMPTCPNGQELCVYPNGISAADPSLGLSDTAPIEIATCCSANPPPSCRASAICACPMAPAACNASALGCDISGDCELALSIAPNNECIPRGGSLQLGAYDQLGSAADVTWTVRAADAGGAGHISAGGALVAPARDTTLEVTATSNTRPGVHVTATVLVAETCGGWDLTTSAVGAFSGDLVSLPFAVASDEGYPVFLGQLEGQSPMGTLILPEHPGRTEGCRGPTGPYIGQLHISAYDDPTQGVSRAASSENALIDIERFDSVAFVAEVRALGSGVQQGNDQELPTSITGQITLPGSGCADPAESTDFGRRFGHYQQPDAHMCIEMFEGGIVNQMFWDQLCTSLPCVQDDPCPATGRVGRCDLRAGSVSAPFTQVQTHYAGGMSTYAELVQACVLQGGRWLP